MGHPGDSYVLRAGDNETAALSPAQARIQKNDHESRDKTSLLELLSAGRSSAASVPLFARSFGSRDKNFVPK